MPGRIWDEVDLYSSETAARFMPVRFFSVSQNTGLYRSTAPELQ
jgi:hypothetical protein